jgi:membrane associated rhomboid family serine protease
MPSCVRHPDRPTGLRCTRCDRPACPECLREASVGYQCVDCVNEGRRTTRQARTVVGAPVSQRLIVVPTLIAINVAVFVITVAQAHSLGNNGNSKLSEDWWLWPPIVAGGEWWRLLTAGFLHSGPVHIALNMLALYMLGRELEPLLGRVRFTAIYLISLLGGSTSVFLFGGDAPVVGASGAVFGLMGAIVVVVLRLKLNPRPVLMIIAINIFISVAVPNVSLLGHLGGLVVGALATAAMIYAPARSRTVWQAGTFVVLTIALVGLIVLRDAQFGDLTCERNPVVVMQCTPVSQSGQ